MLRALFNFYDRFRAKPALEIYTDGSLKNGSGSWAYVVASDGVVIQEAAGRAKRTTSLRMEFMAVIEALKALPPESHATIYSDARVMIDAVTGESKARKTCPNQDLLNAVRDLCRGHVISWKWVRAHSGIPLNERCDELCAAARAR